MQTMNTRSVRWISFLLGLFLLLSMFGGAYAQPCGDVGCWQRREPIAIYGNAGFTRANGVVSGTGSQTDPYVIEGWHIVASGASFGIHVEGTSSYFVIRNCVIETASEAGIHFYAVRHGSIEVCHLLRNDRGILFENSYDNGISENLIALNLYGVDLIAGTRNTSITKNTFVDNGRHGHDPAGRNIWFCAAVGNFWDDYEGGDGDCDGIGEAPYPSPVDRYPLMVSPWRCTLPVNDICSLHCDDSTQILKTIGPVGPCDPLPESPCGSSGGCTSAPSISPCPPATCDPDIDVCADQVLTCLHPTATLTAEFRPGSSGCGACTIEWTNSQGNLIGTGPRLEVNEPGVYTVRMEGADGCIVSETVTVLSDVSVPVVRATVGGELSCASDVVVLEAAISGGQPPYEITWSRSGVGVVGHGDTLTVTQPGAYLVTATGENGCSSSDTVVVEQNLQAPRVQTMVSGEISCAVRQVKASAVPSNGLLPYTFEWHGPSGGIVGTSADLFVSEAGTYTVYVAGANGCTAWGSVIVTEVTATPTVNVIVDGMLTCAIDEVSLTANVSHGRPPYEIEWVGPSGNLLGTAPMLKASQPGMYTVTVTGANGCFASMSARVDQDTILPTVDAGPDVLLSEEITQVLLSAEIGSPTGTYTVEWTDATGAVLSTGQEVTVDRPGEYTVTVTRDTGCSASDTVAVHSEIITEVMLDSGIVGLAVFGQLTLDGVPIPDTTFHFIVESVDEVSGVEISSVSLRSGTGEGFRANGAEVNYIIPGNSVVTFQIHQDQFVAGKWYNLPHLPIDPPGAAAVKFF